MRKKFLGSQNASTSDFFDLFLSNLGEESGLNNDGLLGQISTAQDLGKSGARDVNDWSLLLVVCVLGAGLFGNEGPDLVQVDGGAVLVHLIGVHVEVPHTDLKESLILILILMH